jgi:hypothetical protein
VVKKSAGCQLGIEVGVNPCCYAFSAEEKEFE